MSMSTAGTVARRSANRVLLGLTVASGVAYGLGAVVTPLRLWPAILLMCFYLFCLGLAGMLFLALTSVTGGRWCAALLPVPRAMAATLPLVAPLLAIVVLIGIYNGNYPWTHAEGHHPASFFFKDWWLSPIFFALRTVAYLVVFSLFALAMGRGTGRSATAAVPKSLAALWIVVFAVFFSLANVDWIMSLTPEWFSTMFGVYQFSGIFLSGLAAIAVVAILLARAGAWQQPLTEDHLSNLSILIFGFSSFWMYIWLSQYMLIWYANMPEETFYFTRRVHGLWGPLFVLNIFLNWVVPFVVLMPRAAKRNAGIVLKVAVIVLVGRWLDLYLMIAPSETVTQPAFGLCEIASILGTLGLGGLLIFYALRKRKTVGG
jgi:hypothetical protein